MKKKSLSHPGIVVNTDSVLNRILLAFSILSGLSLIATILFYQRKMGSLLMVAALLTTIAIAKMMIWRGVTRLASVFTVSCIWLIFAVNVLWGGGLASNNVIFFVSFAVIAGLLLGEQATLWVAGAGVALGFGMALMAITGHLPAPYFVHTSWGDLVNLIFALAVVATALNLALRERDHALHMANQQLSDRLEAEEALKKSEERYRSLVENADEAILVIQDGMVKFANHIALQSFGYSQQELTSIPIFELIYPEDRNAVIERYMQKIKGDPTPTRYTYRVIPKSGQVVWIEISSVQMTGKEGRRR